jgi:hypothetical protein
MARSTKTAKLSDGYRNSAKLIEEGKEDHLRGACCIAMDQIAMIDGDVNNVQVFYDLFKPNEGHNALWWGEKWEDDARSCRILALCFMAALVEAGDA